MQTNLSKTSWCGLLTILLFFFFCSVQCCHHTTTTTTMATTTSHTHTHFAQAKFDFAQYLIAFWRHEIVGLQEIAISTWGLFIAAFWLVVGTRYLVGGVTWNDTGYTTTAVGLNWLCFFAMLILVMEGFAARLALNDYVCEIVTGQKGSTVLDAMKHLSKISEGKPGQIWHNMCIIGYKCFLGCLCGLDAWMHGSPSFFSPFSVVSKKIGGTLCFRPNDMGPRRCGLEHEIPSPCTHEKHRFKDHCKTVAVAQTPRQARR